MKTTITKVFYKAVIIQPAKNAWIIVGTIPIQYADKLYLTQQEAIDVLKNILDSTDTATSSPF